MSTIGLRIKKIRKQYSLTQEELGKLIGVQNAAISKIENDRVMPTEASLKLICSTYHINYNWLVSGEGDMMQELNADELVDKYAAGESDLFRAMVRTFSSLPDDEWIKLRDLIERIKKEGHP